MDEELPHSYLSNKENEDIISVTSSGAGRPLQVTKSNSTQSSSENQSTLLRSSISHGNIVHIRNELNQSGRKTRELCKDIKTVSKTTESNITNHPKSVDNELEYV